MRIPERGVPVTEAWAVINCMGEEGYFKLARQTFEATRSILQGIKAIKDLKIMGQPDMSLIAVASDTVNIFHLIDDMHLKGWYVQPVLAFDNSPEHMHITISAWIHRIPSTSAHIRVSFDHASAGCSSESEDMFVSEIPLSDLFTRRHSGLILVNIRAVKFSGSQLESFAHHLFNISFISVGLMS